MSATSSQMDASHMTQLDMIGEYINMDELIV
jgi:hypothetical protein